MKVFSVRRAHWFDWDKSAETFLEVLRRLG